MNFTSFNTIIASNDADSIISLFEELGFERTHSKKEIGSGKLRSVRMRYTTDDGKKFHVDVAAAPLSEDFITIRMNVDDLDEACGMFEERGYKNINGDKLSETPSSKAATMISPSGLKFSIVKHIKDHD